MVRLLVVVSLLSSPALALDKGQSLFVVRPGVALLATPALEAKKVLELALHERVSWVGPAGPGGLQQVVTDSGKVGFVAVTDLSAEVPRVDAPRPAWPEEMDEAATRLRALEALNETVR